MDLSGTLHAGGIWVSLAGLVRIGLLPRTSFRPGRRTLAWWLNSLPFWVAGTGLLAVLLGVASPVTGAPGATSLARSALASVLAVWALVLMARASGAHERRPSLWHQPGDVPDALVTTGPYARVRHPFYTAFLLVLLGCALAAPHESTLGALAFGAYRLNGTATAEEARFLRSELGTRYAEYVLHTGRFLPRLRRNGLRRTHVGS